MWSAMGPGERGDNYSQFSYAWQKTFERIVKIYRLWNQPPENRFPFPVWAMPLIRMIKRQLDSRFKKKTDKVKRPEKLRILTSNENLIFWHQSGSPVPANLRYLLLLLLLIVGLEMENCVKIEIAAILCFDT